MRAKCRSESTLLDLFNFPSRFRAEYIVLPIRSSPTGVLYMVLQTEIERLLNGCTGSNYWGSAFEATNILTSLYTNVVLTDEEDITHLSNNIRNYFDVVYSSNWSWVEGFIPWPQRSPDLICLGFLFRCSIKIMICENLIEFDEDLVALLLELLLKKNGVRLKIDCSLKLKYALLEKDFAIDYAVAEGMKTSSRKKYHALFTTVNVTRGGELGEHSALEEKFALLRVIYEVLSV
ncbi:hypothetical protein TNIN_83751 [Trichonephila inaurata madagascariensis]|uniref:Uncharacterized protein n=1 Tax=Trichonephila inaurata madagascariensis TaxID=2747483 RepID=A0A8X6XZR5_9ARAC|nr:hypothetical protein TNIN_83751 [Trichonephila inaurata madagascariensis]